MRPPRGNTDRAAAPCHALTFLCRAKSSSISSQPQSGVLFTRSTPLPAMRNKTIRTAGVVLVKINGRSPVKRLPPPLLVLPPEREDLYLTLTLTITGRVLLVNSL